jgi:hypothetical protein
VKHLTAKLVALFCVVSCGTLAAVEVWPTRQQVQTGDQNGDGRPDLWRRYDAHGRLTEIDRDTNFDGSPDIQEFFQSGVLVRRESDRNFNGQTDLVEEFDPRTRAEIRSVVDVDYDGIADVLVLFRDGRPVFSKQIREPNQPAQRTEHASASRPRDGVHLSALIDPSESDLSVRGARIASNSDDEVLWSTSGGLPRARFTLVGRLGPSASIVRIEAEPDALTFRLPHASRAPPVF